MHWRSKRDFEDSLQKHKLAKIILLYCDKHNTKHTFIESYSNCFVPSSVIIISGGSLISLYLLGAYIVYRYISVLIKSTRHRFVSFRCHLIIQSNTVDCIPYLTFLVGEIQKRKNKSLFNFKRNCTMLHVLNIHSYKVGSIFP